MKEKSIKHCRFAPFVRSIKEGVCPNLTNNNKAQKRENIQDFIHYNLGHKIATSPNGCYVN